MPYPGMPMPPQYHHPGQPYMPPIPMYPCMHPPQPFMAPPPYPGYAPYGAPMGPPESAYGYGAPYMFGGHGPMPQGGLQLEGEDSQMEEEREESCSADEISSVASKPVSHAPAIRQEH
mmetsp:Transcript_47371/g.62684  ORF Transcript_47371/g.62684 Transcript_47371/m.62684 type:complete len:118 (+) Transcript_47371:1825-2178(+)